MLPFLDLTSQILYCPIGNNWKEMYALKNADNYTYISLTFALKIRESISMKQVVYKSLMSDDKLVFKSSLWICSM